MSEGAHESPGPDNRALRELFPYLGEAAYLNTAAAGLSWRGQGAAAARFYDEHKSRGYSGRLAWRGELDRTRQLLARRLPIASAHGSSSTELTQSARSR